MNVRDVISITNGVVTNSAGLGGEEIHAITCDSRHVQEGDLFVAIRGAALDGTQFIPAAVRQGARVIVYDAPFVSLPDEFHGSALCVSDARLAYGALMAAWYQYPSREMGLIGVTGTNGKTTVTHILQHILRSVARCGLIGTIVCDTGIECVESKHTTPDAGELESLLRTMRNNGLSFCAMEVSSHSLHQYRTAGVSFDGAILTNVTQDHLDYHGTMEHYYNSKRLLFTEYPVRFSIINTDCPYGERLAGDPAVRGKVITYGIHSAATVRAEAIESTLNGLRFTMSIEGTNYEIVSSLTCMHNVYNILAACAYAYYAGVMPEKIVESIRSFPGVKGRMEAIHAGQPFHVFVDYAHTPDAFHNIFSSIKPLAKGRIITVFGCGGDRDRTKRPLMGDIAASHSDYVIVTSDNPRTEDPQGIINDIIKGVGIRGVFYEIIPDRAAAIHAALSVAEPEDTVLVLGKGHEEYMIIGKEKRHFSDQETIAAYLSQRIVPS